MSASVAHNPSPSEYITHHLGHLASKKQDFIIDFSVIHFDTLFWSILMGMVGCLVMYLAARKATPGVPGRFQGFVEMLVEWVEAQSKSVVHGNRKFVAPLALTVFVWVVLMNSLDLVPIDMIPALVEMLGLTHVISYHRIVPTADLNGTMGIAVGVLALMLYYNVKIN